MQKILCDFCGAEAPAQQLIDGILKDGKRLVLKGTVLKEGGPVDVCNTCMKEWFDDGLADEE